MILAIVDLAMKAVALTAVAAGLAFVGALYAIAIFEPDTPEETDL